MIGNLSSQACFSKSNWTPKCTDLSFAEDFFYKNKHGYTRNLMYVQYYVIYIYIHTYCTYIMYQPFYPTPIQTAFLNHTGPPQPCCQLNGKLINDLISAASAPPQCTSAQTLKSSRTCLGVNVYFMM